MFIELQTGAFTRSIKCNKGTTFQLTGTLGVGESVVFEQPDGAGGWFTSKVGGTEVSITADNTVVSISQPALIRVNKPITVAAAGIMVVSIMTEEDIFVSPFTNPFTISSGSTSTGTEWNDEDVWNDSDVWED